MLLKVSTCQAADLVLAFEVHATVCNPWQVWLEKDVAVIHQGKAAIDYDVFDDVHIETSGHK